MEKKTIRSEPCYQLKWTNSDSKDNDPDISQRTESVLESVLEVDTNKGTEITRNNKDNLTKYVKHT